MTEIPIDQTVLRQLFEQELNRGEARPWAAVNAMGHYIDLQADNILPEDVLDREPKASQEQSYLLGIQAFYGDAGLALQRAEAPTAIEAIARDNEGDFGKGVERFRQNLEQNKNYFKRMAPEQAGLIDSSLQKLSRNIKPEDAMPTLLILSQRLYDAREKIAGKREKLAFAGMHGLTFAPVGSGLPLLTELEYSVELADKWRKDPSGRALAEKIYTSLADSLQEGLGANHPADYLTGVKDAGEAFFKLIEG